MVHREFLGFCVLHFVCTMSYQCVHVKQSFTKKNYVALRFALHWFKVKKKVSRKKSLIDPESLVMSVCQEFL